LKKSKKVEVKDEKGKVVKSYWIASRRWIQFDKALNRAYQKKREQTKQLMYALANQLYSEYDLVLIGDYTPQPGTGISKGMRKAMNNESFIGELKRTLSFVAEKSGKHFLEYEEYNTTKKCNECGYINTDLTIDERFWNCPVCKTYHIRDENSAINGLKGNYFMSCSDLFLQSNFKIVQRCAWEWNFSNWMRIPRELNDERGSSSAKSVA
jgi:putative transposase